MAARREITTSVTCSRGRRASIEWLGVEPDGGEEVGGYLCFRDAIELGAGIEACHGLVVDESLEPEQRVHDGWMTLLEIGPV